MIRPSRRRIARRKIGLLGVAILVALSLPEATYGQAALVATSTALASRLTVVATAKYRINAGDELDIFVWGRGLNAANRAGSADGIHGARAARRLRDAARHTGAGNGIRGCPPRQSASSITPTILVLDDIMLVARNVDDILMIVEEGSTRGGDIAHALRILSPTPVIGSVLNKSLTAWSIRHLDWYYYDAD